MTAVQTIATAEPSVAPPRPLVIHYVPEKGDGSPGELALCGRLWDRLVPGGRRCPECVALFRLAHPGRALP